jgi:hypothetical protein
MKKGIFSKDEGMHVTGMGKIEKMVQGPSFPH